MNAPDAEVQAWGALCAVDLMVSGMEMRGDPAVEKAAMMRDALSDVWLFHDKGCPEVEAWRALCAVDMMAAGMRVRGDDADGKAALMRDALFAEWRRQVDALAARAIWRALRPFGFGDWDGVPHGR